MGLLLRAVRPAAGRVRGVAGRVRPDLARLLPARVHASRLGAQHPRATTVRVHADRFLPGDLPAGDPVASARAAVEPVPARAAAVPPAGQPVDDGGDPARGRPQSAERAAARMGRATSDSVRAPARWAARCGGPRVGAMEPRDLRRHARGDAPRRGVRHLADGRDRPQPGAGTALLVGGRAPYAVPEDVPVLRTAGPDGLPGASGGTTARVAPAVPDGHRYHDPAGTARYLAPCRTDRRRRGLLHAFPVV